MFYYNSLLDGSIPMQQQQQQQHKTNEEKTHRQTENFWIELFDRIFLFENIVP